MSGFQLVPLACPQCGSGIAAEGEDLVYYCVSCRSAYRFAGAGPERLVPVEVSFLASPAVAAGRWLPFWLLPAKVTLHERDGGRGGLVDLLGFLGGGAAGSDAPAAGTFAIPAFAAPLAEVTALAIRYTRELPGLLARGGERLGERLTGGRLDPADAEKLAHYVLVASEAAKPDTLRTLRYTLDFGPARLLGVPFVQSGGRWTDGYLNLPATLPEG
ncbi:MAG TPA: hypothetical protein VF121_03025 [Thermoanaerobaculia bacterium]|nr:hypothetical protein [Thermoanaerobaculia bacterium]